MAKQSAFAGAHTVKKLDAIAKYLRAYRNVMKNTSFRTIFFDAFAGTGELPVNLPKGGLFPSMDKEELVEGSAKRALQVEPPFHEYIFVEKMRGKAEELAKLASQFPHVSERVRVQNGDANECLIAFCRNTNWNLTRAVVFLDPFGNQVRWQTLEAIAKCPIDLWYLFPSHLGVNRQISKDGSIDPTHGASLDALYGTPRWRDVFVRRETIADLFGETEVSTKQVDADKATSFMIERMKTVVKGGVLDDWLPLGRDAAHWYSLIFAWGNDSRKARDIAVRIAKNLMQRK